MHTSHHYICKVIENNGEAEYTHRFVFSCPEAQAHQYAEDILMDYRVGAQKDEDGNIWYDDDTAVCLGRIEITPISQGEINVLREFVPMFCKG